MFDHDFFPETGEKKSVSPPHRGCTLQRDGRGVRDGMICGAGPSGEEGRRWKRRRGKTKRNRCGCEAENASLHAGHPNKTRDSSPSIGNYTREVLLVVVLLHCFDNGGTKPCDAESGGREWSYCFSERFVKLFRSDFLYPYTGFG